MVKWLYLDLNSFFASCEQQEKPELRGKPVAVIPMMANTTSVLAASYEAKAFGIKTGTSVVDAKKMCPGLQFVLSKHPTYVRYHHKVKEVVESCVPIHSVCSVDEFACELTGSQQDVQVATALAEKIRTAIYQQVGEAISCSIGLGPNVLLSKMATDMKKPRGLVVIEPTDLPTKLVPLKLRDVPGIGPKMEYRLNQKGIHTMGQLLN
ncbi:MAG: DNA polymerase, partial [Proteobacteria bacterium]